MSRRQFRRREKRRRRAEDQSRIRPRQLALGAGLTAGATLAMSGAAQAATLTVGSSADTSGASDCATATNTDCTLRDAITAADAASGSTITFAASLSGSTITLGSDLPTVTVPTTVTGPGASQLTVTGNDLHRIFTIDQTSGTGPVSISGLTMTHGHAGGNGGAIYDADASLTVSDAVISASTITGGRGGGIYSGGPDLTVHRSTVTGNSGHIHGGGIFAYYQLYLSDSNVSANSAVLGYGGGVYAVYSGGANHRGPHTIVNSTITGNNAARDGGGVAFYGSTSASDRLTIENSTITGNYASGSAGSGTGMGAGHGGGVGSQIQSTDYLGPVLENTIVANNTAKIGDPDVAGNLLNASFSLIKDPGSAGITTDVTGSNITGVDPQLGPLQDNGGPTYTEEPSLSSVVIDCGSSEGLTADQRGLTRPVDLARTNSTAAGADGSDIGAVELQSGATSGACPNNAPVTPQPSSTPAATGQRAAALKKCKKKANLLPV